MCVEVKRLTGSHDRQPVTGLHPTLSGLLLIRSCRLPERRLQKSIWDVNTMWTAGSGHRWRWGSFPPSPPGSSDVMLGQEMILSFFFLQSMFLGQTDGKLLHTGRMKFIHMRWIQLDVVFQQKYHYILSVHLIRFSKLISNIIMQFKQSTLQSQKSD